jgi:subtilisin family serine protease
MADRERYIILPRRGVRGGTTPAESVLSSFPPVASTQAAKDFRLDAFGADMLVHDTVAETGPKLVEMYAASAARMNSPNSPVRAVKEVFFPIPRPIEEIATMPPTATPPAGSPPSGAPPAGSHKFEVKVIDAINSAPIGGVTVTAFSNFQNRVGVRGVTAADGRVHLTLPTANIERILANPVPGTGYWSGYRTNVAASGIIQIAVPPLTLPYVDGVRHYYANSNYIATTGVKVGVLDTGCGPHADLNIVIGRNTVTGEARSAYQDGHYHGTHVAGLVGARGVAPNGIRGVAPGVPICAFRVFGAGNGGASNYAILKAMIFAADEKCDIINLSLGGGFHNEVVEEAILDARNQGMLVVIAAGNDYRGTVSYPAAYPGSMAVSAMGRMQTYPLGSSEELQVVRPPNSTTDPSEFIAHFSNVGSKVEITAPGVGAISTLPNNQIGPLSGTSMAAPVIAGAAACLLSQNVPIYNMPRDRTRSDVIEKLVKTNARQHGFGLTYEGFGLPTSPMV